MQIFRYAAFPLLLLTLVFSSCSPLEKVKKSTDVNYRLTKANEYYEKKKFAWANDLYRDLIPVVKGTRNYEPLYYRYAYSYYYMKNYLAAGYHFKNFTEFFPASKEAEECEFMYAICLFKESPKPTLEQTNTIKAMEALQSFINSHPDSKRLGEINAMMSEGRGKLEQKDANAALLYFNISQFKAAAISYKNLLKEYPESSRSDFYQYMIIRSSYKYAKASIPAKQQERYNDVIDAYQELKSQYPTSEFLKDGEKYVTLSSQNINNLSSK